MESPNHKQPIDWDYLLDKIKEEECLVIIGNEVFLDDNKNTIHARLINQLDISNNSNIKRHYPGDDFFLFEHKSFRTQFCHQIKRFYKNENVTETHKLLSEIPFHIYLTVTPDTLLAKMFSDQNFRFQHGYYKKNTAPQQITKPKQDNPLIYNLFGCIESEESLILSHDDLYDYFKSIFARHSMPIELKDELHRIKNILFLGVSFENWYLQILLREFELHNQQYAFTRFASTSSQNNEIYTLCIEQFNIQFIDRGADDFIRELHSRVSLDSGLSFRVPQKDNKDIPNLVKEKIAKGEIELALDYCSTYLENTEFIEAVDLIRGRLGRLKKRSFAGIIKVDDVFLEEAIIAKDILDIINAKIHC